MTSPFSPNNAESDTDPLLEMTVYPLPGTAHRKTLTAEQARRGQFKLFWLMALCSAPVLIAYLLFYVVRPGGQAGYGALIDPARAMPVASVQRLSGESSNLASLKGQWLLVNVAPGICQGVCEQRLLMTRQLRESMGKDKDRIDWVWLVSDTAPVSPALMPALKDAIVLRMSKQDLAQWLTPEPGKALADHLYLVDPLGNYMMRFPMDLSLKEAPKARRDLSRLLKATLAWDAPGRETP
jgi:hypothetical protein